MRVFVVHDEQGEIMLLATVSEQFPGNPGFKTLPGESFTEVEVPAELQGLDPLDEGTRSRLDQLARTSRIDNTGEKPRLVKAPAN